MVKNAGKKWKMKLTQNLTLKWVYPNFLPLVLQVLKRYTIPPNMVLVGVFKGVFRAKKPSFSPKTVF